MSQPAHPFTQASYQVRLEWGVDGLRRLAPSDIVVVVDVLRLSSTVARAVADKGAVALDDADTVSINGAVVARTAGGRNNEPMDAAESVDAAGEPDAVGEPIVVLGALVNASAAADAVLAEQQRRGRRTSIAVIAAGERTGREPGAPVRFAAEDLLGAGAVVDALIARGIDHTSPEATVAAESFAGLRGAVRHLLTASGSGRELLERGLRAEVLAAAEIDAVGVVPILREGRFVSW